MAGYRRALIYYYFSDYCFPRVNRTVLGPRSALTVVSLYKTRGYDTFEFDKLFHDQS